MKKSIASLILSGLVAFTALLYIGGTNILNTNLAVYPLLGLSLSFILLVLAIILMPTRKVLGKCEERSIQMAVWFKEHLNWTFLIAWLVALSLILSGSRLESDNIAILMMSCGMAIHLSANTWYLIMKKRSLLFLLLNLLNLLGLIWTLALENKREAIYFSPKEQMK